MTIDLNKINKNDFINILSGFVLSKIEHLEIDYSEKLNHLNEINLPYYLEAQEQSIQNWRQFLKYLQKYQFKNPSRVEDGVLVKLAGYPSAEWIFIYKLRCSLSIEGTPVEVDDGQLGRNQGSIQGARPGEKITLLGDGRGVSDINVQILNVF